MASPVVPHILILGDSISMYGCKHDNRRHGVPATEPGYGYVAGLRDLYQGRMLVSCRAQGGYNTVTMLHEWDTMYPTDILFTRVYICLGTNDCVMPTSAPASLNYNVPIARYQDNLVEMVRRVVEQQNRLRRERKVGATFASDQVVLCGAAQANPAQRDAVLLERAQASSTPFVGCGRDNVQPMLYSTAAAAAAERCGASFLDWFSAFPAEGSAAFAHAFFDGLHPSAMSHRTVLTPLFQNDLAAHGLGPDLPVVALSGAPAGLAPEIAPRRSADVLAQIAAEKAAAAATV